VTETREATQRIAHLDDLLQEVESITDSDARETALAAIQGLLELYGDGLRRVVDMLATEAIRLSEDDLVAHLLLLHGLHPVGLEARVRQALESVRPYLQAHGGNVELIGISDGVARLRLQGTCTGCSSSETTLKRLVERAIADAAPDLDSVETEGAGSSAGASFIGLDCLVQAVPAAAG
jgi:Fe-S cluster biogenesis protein NfuA